MNGSWYWGPWASLLPPLLGLDINVELLFVVDFLIIFCIVALIGIRAYCCYRCSLHRRDIVLLSGDCPFIADVSMETLSVFLLIDFPRWFFSFIGWHKRISVFTSISPFSLAGMNVYLSPLFLIWSVQETCLCFWNLREFLSLVPGSEPIGGFYSFSCRSVCSNFLLCFRSDYFFFSDVSIGGFSFVWWYGWRSRMICLCSVWLFRVA